MDPYLDLAGFTLRTVMPSEDVDIVETKYPGFVLARLKIGTSRINARAGKRYAPFAAPYPELVLGWLTAIVTVEAYEKRGWNPDDQQNKAIVDEATQAFADLKELADGVDGLFDLPLREDTTASGIARGGPLVYSEAGPYEWMDHQVRAARGR